MGWLDGWFGSSQDADPLAKLDPKLREFLEKEAPVKLNKTTRTSSAQDAPPPVTASQPKVPVEITTPQETEGVPRQSLYQDGRYAHLWKSYKPLSAVEEETKTGNERLTDVLDSYKDRKNQLGRAALENCADEQVDWSQCMKSGSVRAKMTMCREEVRKFERCYTVQSKLLKALGYLSALDRPPEVEEAIQMHADTLFHRMLDQEAAIAAAKKEGRPQPQFSPLLSKPDLDSTEPYVPPGDEDSRKKWMERLDKLPAEERLTEEEAHKAEAKERLALMTRVQGIWKEQAKVREAQKSEQKETMLDKVSAIFGRS